MCQNSCAINLRTEQQHDIRIAMRNIQYDLPAVCSEYFQSLEEDHYLGLFSKNVVRYTDSFSQPSEPL